MLGAALLARNAVKKGLTAKPWVKTTLAPGSKVVTDYYEKAGLWPYLEKLGFYPVGYGCTTCIGNSGPLIDEISAGQRERPRRHRGALGQPQLRGPHQPRREDELPGQPAARDRVRARRLDELRLRDRAARHGPGRQRRLPEGHLADGRGVRTTIDSSINQEMFTTSTPTSSRATSAGSRCRPRRARRFEWDPKSTYVRKPPYFDGMTPRAHAGHRHRRRPRARQARRLGHHRPHQPGRQDQGRQPGRAVPRRARRRAARTTTPTARVAATTR